MTKRAFGFEINTSSAWIVVARLPLTPDCSNGEAVDAAVEALKRDLDVVAVKMKAALRRQAAAGPEAKIIPLPPRPV
jgi:hypothetical protein